MATNNMNNLTTLIKRLEAATSRLEDIASSAFEPATTHATATPVPGATPAPPAPPMPSPIPSVAPPPAPPQPSVSPMVEAYDKAVNDDLKDFTKISVKLGGLIAEQAKHFSQAFSAQREFLLVTTKAKEPDMDSPAFTETIKDLQKEMSQVDNIRQSNRASEFKDHLAMVADGVTALGWIVYSPGPVDHVAELFGGAQMWGNKVLKMYKERDPVHVGWVQAFNKLFKSLITYIGQYHPKGVQWNQDGIDAAEAVRQVKSGASAATAGGAPPPPPPPPPLPTFDNIPPPPGPAPAVKGGAAPDMGAVFEQLNQGEGITSTLRKVDSSQMTHKNPSLRAQAPVPSRKDSSSSIGRSKSPAPPGKKPKPESMRVKKPPKKELDGNKWIIENFDNPDMEVEIDAAITHSILISRCKNTTIRVNGKANAISVDNSSRTSLILDSLVSSVDVIKCPNFALQVLGTLPTVMLDQVDGGTIYLSRDSLNADIFTSKCTNVNINIPPEDEQGDYSECAVPEQIRSYVRDGQLVNEIVEHAG